MIQKLIDDELAQQQEKKLLRERSGKWSPSSFGKCFRYQFWHRKNEPETDPIEPRILRVFEAGKIFEDFVVKTLLPLHPEAQVGVKVEIEDVLGYADIVFPEEVIELKTQHSRAFWYRQDEEWKNIEPKILPNIYQAMYYAIYLKKPSARIVYISKDDVCIQEYALQVTPRWIDEINTELSVLRDFWARNELPPTTARAYPNELGKPQECSMCNYCTKCWGKKLQRDRVKKVKANV